MVRIVLLGEPRVEVDGERVVLGDSWRARSLLIWLALNPGPKRRDQLASLFWPDILDSSARASLRNGLWAIRRALGPAAADVLVASRDHIELVDGTAAWVDARAFAEHLRRGELADALELCGGEPLAGIDEDWAFEYRDSHRERLSEAYEALAARAEADDDRRAAIDWARRRVALDPLAEDAQRALIARFIAAGDRSAALASYGRFRERLRTELGISPSEETRALVLELRAPDVPAAPVASAGAASGAAPGTWRPGERFPLPPRLRGASGTPLVGRGRELARMRDLWASVESGAGAHVLRVTGEPGIGKSRLARELAIEAERGGAVVLFGAADEEVPAPLQTWIEALDHLFAQLGADGVRMRLADASADLDPIAPRLSGSLQAQDSREQLIKDRRFRLYDSVGATLESVSRDAPVLLLADDLHWADDSTAALLRHVVESRSRIRLLVVATQRSGTQPSDALTETMARLSREGSVTDMALTGLTDAGVAALSKSLSSRDMPDEFVTAIARESTGNPFFVGELVRHIDESGASADVLALTEADVPERVRSVVDLRIGRLSPTAIRLLSVAAVIGTEFDLELLELVGAAPDAEVLACLEEALEARLITEREYEDRDAFAFSHVLVRRTLLQRLSRAARRRVHARIAEALERSRGSTALIEIAHHMCQAGHATDRERALDYATRAAEQAVDDLAYSEAVNLFTRARSLLADDDPRRRRLGLKRAIAYQALFHSVWDTSAGQAHTGAAESLAERPSGSG